MHIWLVSRHYIGEQNTLSEYREGAQHILTAKSLIDKRKLPISLGTKVTAAEDKAALTVEMKEEIYEINEKLLSENVSVFYDQRDRGSGLSFIQMAFNPTYLSTPEPTVVETHDIDQFVIDTDEALDNIVDFANKMVADNSLWSAGSRSLEVKLGVHTRNSNLRIIQELFHSASIGNKLKVEGKVPDGVLPAYRDFGESTSAFGVLNLSHAHYRTLVASVHGYGYILAPVFVAEYYTALKASTLGNESPRYVYTYPNVYYTQPTEEREFENAEKSVRTSEGALAKTDVRDMLIEAVRKDETVDAISEYYDKGEVKLVQQWMLEALTK